VLVVDDEPEFRRCVSTVLTRMRFTVLEAGSGTEAAVIIDSSPLDLVLSDLKMPGGGGIEVVTRLRTKQPGVPVVILTGHSSIADCVAAMRAGAANFITKPFHPAELERVVRDTLDANQSQSGEVSRPGRAASTLLGDSPQMKGVLRMVERVAGTDTTVLLTGETGTGKEVVARLLHGLSSRAGSPFVPINCGAIPENLIESILFGHAKGAFTGASERRVGSFAQANGGTLLLDEIGDLSLSLQVKLLRVLQERQVTPIGDARPTSIDIRVIAATHRNLAEKVADGSFRQDLFFRLNVIEIELPPLRDRVGDVDPLVSYFVDVESSRQKRELKLEPALQQRLVAYPWPGNVRELENIVQRLAVLSHDGILREQDLPPRLRVELRPTLPRRDGIEPGPTGDLQDALDRVEVELIEATLAKAQGNKTLAAKLLGINRTTLLEKLRRHERAAARSE